MTIGATLLDHLRGTHLAESARRQELGLVEPAHKSRLGQFMTPASVAEFMASLFDPSPDAVHLLDAGAGMGALTAAFVARECASDRPPKSIHVSLFEVDSRLHQALEETLLQCGRECALAGIEFTHTLYTSDFLELAGQPLFEAPRLQPAINRVILNPPYAKIGAHSGARARMREIGLETTNLYSAFVALALDQLADDGELIAITPRSFCNGPYFTPFRRWILDRAALLRAHLYDSRKAAFGDDGVLQENIIFKLRRSRSQPSKVELSSSAGPTDAPSFVQKVAFSEIVRPDDPHRFIRLLQTDQDVRLGDRIRALGCSLAELGFQVSTGRVVDFRATAFLRKVPETGTVPLVYPSHLSAGRVMWPLRDGKKPNAIQQTAETAHLLVPRGYYVLTKRFTAKEERRRIVAAVCDPADVPGDVYGFENHLNYFHRDGAGLDPVLARGLAAFLNSSAVDEYFRQFSGHTQVNATDLRTLRYPSREQLISIGTTTGATPPIPEEVDALVVAHLWPQGDQRT